MQIAKIGLAFALFCIDSSHAQTAQKKLDTRSLGNQSAATPSPSPQAAKVQNRSKAIVVSNEGLLDEKAAKEAANTIKSLTTLLGTTSPGVLRNRILLNRAIAYHSYARQKMMDAKRYVLTDDLRGYFNASIRDSNEVIAATTASKEQVIRAHDIAATSALFIEKNDLAREHFLQELKLGPSPEKAGRIGLLLAEQYFDQQKFKEAVDFYTKYFAQMTPQWKELALYKLGWCMINLKQIDRAQAYFFKIAHANSPTGVGRDAIRDLAYLTGSKAGSVPEILATSEKFTVLQDKLTYLNDVLISLEGLNFPAEHAQVAQSLLQIETNPGNRVSILLSQVRMQKKAYASAAHFKAFQVLANYVRTLNEVNLKPVMEKHQASMELETENIFRAFIDTYAGRLKVIESPALTGPQMVGGLKFIVQFFQKYFFTAPHFPIVVELWENLCIDTKDWAGVDEITQFILSDQPRLKDLLENAYLNQIVAIDQLSVDPVKAKELSARRVTRVKEFVEKFPKSTRWPQVAKMDAQNELTTQHFAEAEKLYEQIMVMEPNAQNFYQLQFARFKLSDYQGVLNDSRNQVYLHAKADNETSSHLMDLYRETTLKVAESAKAKDPAQYRQRIEEFIRLSSDPQKARIARVDYFNFLLQSGQAEDAQVQYAALNAEEKSLPIYDSFRAELWKMAIDQEKYELATQSAANPQQRIISILLQGKKVDTKTMDSLKSQERGYFLGLFALFDPDSTIQALSKKGMSANDRDLMILSQRIKRNQWQLVRTPELEKILGKNYAFVEAPQMSELKLEKAMAALAFPDLTKQSPKRQAATVQNNIDFVHRYRKQVVSAITGQTPELQFRVLMKAKELEEKMGDYLVHSPLPAGLTPEQTLQYQEGLKGAGDEFVQQAQQFKLLADKAKEGLEKNKGWLEAHTLPIPDMARWPWPSGSAKNKALAPVFNLSKNGNALGALVLLDYLRATAVESPDDFAMIRTGLILRSNPSEALRIYLLDELTKSKQSSIVQTWAKLTNHSIPEQL